MRSAHYLKLNLTWSLPCSASRLNGKYYLVVCILTVGGIERRLGAVRDPVQKPCLTSTDTESQDFRELIAVQSANRSFDLFIAACHRLDNQQVLAVIAYFALPTVEGKLGDVISKDGNSYQLIVVEG